MPVRVVIEIPKGDDRRRHLNKYDKTTFIDLGPMKDKIPVNDGKMPEHYGFISDTYNAADGDEVDAILFSDKNLMAGNVTEALPIAILHRSDGDEKVIVVEPGSKYGNWDDIEAPRRDLIIRFFSSHHEITSIGSKDEAEKYIRGAKRQTR